MKIDFEDVGSNGGFNPRVGMAWDLRIRWVLEHSGKARAPMGEWKCLPKSDNCWTLKKGSIPNVAGWLFQEVRTEIARVYRNGVVSWQRKPIDHYWEMWVVRLWSWYLAFPAVKPPDTWFAADADMYAREAINDAFLVGNGDLLTLAEKERKLPESERAFCFIYQKQGDVYFCPWNDGNLAKVDAWYSAAQVDVKSPAGHLPMSTREPDVSGADTEGQLSRTHLIYVTSGGKAQRTMPRDYISATA